MLFTKFQIPQNNNWMREKNKKNNPQLLFFANRVSHLASADGLRLARPRGSDSTSASKDRLDLDLGGASTLPNPGLGPTTSQEAPSLPYPKLTQATGNKTGVPSGSSR
jgi:hypothetical protein